jgi:ribosomal protein S18 acetylase RimI-like enzyme
MSLSLIDCTDQARWDRLVEESPHGNVFCSSAFLAALGEEYRLLLVEEKGEPLAGILVILRDGQPYPGQYPLTIYQGVLLGPALCRQPPHSRAKQTLVVLDFLLAELEKRYDRICVCLHHRFEDLRSFSWFHYHEPERGRFRIELQYSGVLDLASVADFDRYLGSIRNLRLREHRRAQSKGFSVEPSTDLDTLDRLYGLTFERQGVARANLEVHLLRHVARAALSRGFGELLFCRDDRGVVASATLFIYDQRCGYYFVGANDPEYRQSGSGTYLMLENLRRCQAKGLACIDFGGINSPNRGDFKTSFNATPVPYFIATWEKPR